MFIELSKNGWKNKGLHKAEVSHVDRDLAKYNWTYLSVKSGDKVCHYALMTAGKQAAAELGVEVRSTVYLHKIVLARKLNIPYSQVDNQTDHKDRNGLNNTRSNIRQATVSQNMCNRRSKYKGIYTTTSGKYWGAINKDKKLYYIPVNESLDEVIAQREKLERKLHGRFTGVAA